LSDLDACVVEILSSRLAWALEQPESHTGLDFPTELSRRAAGTDDALSEDSSIVQEVPSSAVCDFLSTIAPGQSLIFIAQHAVHCLSNVHVSGSLNRQQHRSLQGRWFGTSAQQNVEHSTTEITRGRIFKSSGYYWLVLSIFKKGYGKFRLTRSVLPAQFTLNNKRNVRIHAIKIRRSSIGDTFSLAPLDTKDLVSIRSNFLNVYAQDVDMWTGFSMEYRC
jgi:hypothetical protein